jgi:DNA-binding GntR family transcriptional regulator
VSHLGLPMRTRLTDVMYGEGVTTRKELLEKRSIEPSEDIRNILLTENEVFFARYKSAVESEYPVMEELYIPLVTLLSINDDDILFRPFFDVIEEKGTKKISKVTQTIEVVKLKEEVAYQLKMKEGSYALCVNRIFYSSDGSPIAFSRGIIGGMKKVSMEFERLK